MVLMCAPPVCRAPRGLTIILGSYTFNYGFPKRKGNEWKDMPRVTTAAHFLTEAERRELGRRLAEGVGTPGSLHLMRICAVLLLDSGAKKAALAEQFGVTRRSLNNWLTVYRTSGLNGLLGKRLWHAGANGQDESTEKTGTGRKNKPSVGAVLSKEGQGGVVDQADRPAVSLREVAAAAKVSLSTASFAVSGRTGIAPETKRHVLSVADELGYRPHPYVSTLMKQVSRSKRTRTRVNLAWVHCGRGNHKEDFKLPWGSFPVYEAARLQAQQLGYDNLAPYSCDTSSASLRRLSGILKSRGIIGALVTTGAQRMLPLEDLAGITMVKLSAPYLESHNHHVYADTYQGVLLACAKLWKAGYRRIGLLNGVMLNIQYMGKIDAAWNDFQVVIPEELRIPNLTGDMMTAFIFDRYFANREPTGYVRPPPSLEEEDWQARLADLIRAYRQAESSESQVKAHIATLLLRQWLQRYRPDAILCADSRVLEQIRGMGYRVPEDIGIAHLHLRRDTPGWTGVDHHWQMIGKLAVETLNHLIGIGLIGQSDHPILRAVSGSWVEGNTTRLLEPAVYPKDSYVDCWINERVNFSNQSVGQNGHPG